jgi:hypothetical protein
LIGTPRVERGLGREETVFCVVNARKNAVISGGSVPLVSVSNIEKRQTTFAFDFQSGLALGLDHSSGLLACGGFQGSYYIFFVFSLCFLCVFFVFSLCFLHLTVSRWCQYRVWIRSGRSKVLERNTIFLG